MSWLKAITGGVIGAEALSLIKQYVEKEGGLNAVVKNFQNGGFKRQVDSSDLDGQQPGDQRHRGRSGDRH